MSIRRAGLADLNVVCELYFEFGRTFSKPHLVAPWNPNKIVATVVRCLSHPDAVCFVLEEDGEVIGMMMGQLEELTYSDSYVAQDRVFYVREGKRSLRGLYLLLDSFNKWAKEEGCFSISLTALGSTNNEALVRLLRRWGYHLEGYQVIKLL